LEEAFERAGIEAGDQVDFFFYIGLFFSNVYFYPWQDSFVSTLL